MKSLFRNSIIRSKDSILKESLQSQLVACVKDIQLDHAHSGRFQDSSEAADSLCTVLEAIFIHGIKETLADKMAIAIGDPDVRPEPNFWPALLVFSHRDLIDQIGRLYYVCTDVGRCRVWIRMCLNDGLLTSYLQSMLAQNKSLSSFYKRSAYLRDTEVLDMCITLIAGIESYSFNMFCNTSLLNTWPNPPLVMSGVWSPTMKACPITSGTDIARSLMAEDSASKVAEDSMSSVVSVASYYQSSLESNFDEEEALKIILGTDVEQSREQNKSVEDFSSSPHKNVEIKVDEKVLETTAVEPVVNTEEIKPCEECSIVVEEKSTVNDCTEEEKLPVVKREKESKLEKRKLQSYHSLVESYNQNATTISGLPDLKVLLQKFEPPSKPSTVSTISSISSDSDSGDKLDFEIITEHFDPTNIPEFRMLTQHIYRIATEHGLDAQNYICKTCDQHVGINFQLAKVCGLTGAYYCSDCFCPDPTNEYCVIPARVIYNWDFRRYSVSHKASEFLSQVHLYPMFDISLINPKIYSVVEEMSRLKELRVQLNFLQAYLLTCKGNAVESLQKQIWPREYLYENIHLYSLADLIQASSGVLESTLQKVVDSSRNHILSCTLCIQKGFICEICKDPKVIFPFDLDKTYRCKDCCSVYHDKCLQAGQLCPKCLRIQQRLLSTDSS
ncbi:uncharacterized protein LOC124368879 [Homalodisca vitripennis]|nr:uncharacterized protein LOC124368879 [Homalodisca vitripennis]XP_046682319.1 uncharacterized protein LOC124368879 [Homalodisca vitripennis]XP_046682320.1 uncharacterized protein LOC124368879 [Homalodisca vitripennis]XP_046682321.1 uncharacterized protein LOC124368879 [Homalodisca vitripennis]XP_046682322.1 uncharacterized protein LOC124368879 [Homalodisca vitripennis]